MPKRVYAPVNRMREHIQIMKDCLTRGFVERQFRQLRQLHIRQQATKDDAAAGIGDDGPEIPKYLMPGFVWAIKVLKHSNLYQRPRAAAVERQNAKCHGARSP